MGGWMMDGWMGICWMEGWMEGGRKEKRVGGMNGWMVDDWLATSLQVTRSIPGPFWGCSPGPKMHTLTGTVRNGKVYLR